MEWWNDWKTFGLPRDGGLEDQDVEWVEAVKIIDMAYHQVERETQEEADRKAAQDAKRKR